MDENIVTSDATPEIFVLLRDRAFFKLHYAGDRVSDLAKCLAQEIRHLPDDSRILITNTVCKTLSNGKKN